MGFQTGKFQPSPLLTAYATQRELQQTDRGQDQTDRQMDQKDVEMEIDSQYKKGLISNEQKNIAIRESRLAFDERKYDTTGADLQIAQTENYNAASAINRDTLEQKKKDKLIDEVVEDSKSILNAQFQLGDVSAADLITYDSDTGEYGWHEDFTADNYGVAQNSNNMRKELIGSLEEKYPNLSNLEINRLVNKNWDAIYGENMNAYYGDMNQYMSQAWQDEMSNADTDGDGKVSQQEQSAINDKLSKFIGTSPEFRNVMAPGLISGGMDPGNLLYNISGHNVPVTSDAQAYGQVQQNAKGFTYEMEITESGKVKWNKIPITGGGTGSTTGKPPSGSGSYQISGGNIHSSYSQQDTNALIKRHANDTMIGGKELKNHKRNNSSGNFKYEAAYKDANGDGVYVKPKAIDWTKVGNQFDVKTDSQGNKQIWGFDSGFWSEWIPDAYFTNHYLEGTDLARGKGITALVNRQNPADVFFDKDGVPHVRTTNGKTIALPTVD